jgi:hypothetical protein
MRATVKKTINEKNAKSPEHENSSKAINELP